MSIVGAASSSDSRKITSLIVDYVGNREQSLVEQIGSFVFPLFANKEDFLSKISSHFRGQYKESLDKTRENSLHWEKSRRFMIEGVNKLYETNGEQPVTMAILAIGSAEPLKLFAFSSKVGKVWVVSYNAEDADAAIRSLPHQLRSKCCSAEADLTGGLYRRMAQIFERNWSFETVRSDLLALWNPASWKPELPTFPEPVHYVISSMISAHLWTDMERICGALYRETFPDQRRLTFPAQISHRANIALQTIHCLWISRLIKQSSAIGMVYLAETWKERVHTHSNKEASGPNDTTEVERGLSNFFQVPFFGEPKKNAWSMKTGAAEIEGEQVMTRVRASAYLIQSTQGTVITPSRRSQTYSSIESFGLNS